MTSSEQSRRPEKRDAAPLPQGGRHEAQDLPGRPEHEDDVGLELGPAEGGDDDGLVLAGRPASDHRLRAGPGFGRLRVHPLTAVALPVVRRGFLKSEGDRRQGTGEVGPGEGQRPAVAAADPEGLAGCDPNAQVPGGPSGLFGQGFSRGPHPNR